MFHSLRSEVEIRNMIIDSRVFYFPYFDRKEKKYVTEPSGIELTTLCSNAKPFVQLRQHGSMRETYQFNLKKLKPSLEQLNYEMESLSAYLIIVNEHSCFTVRGQRSKLRI